MSRHVSTQHDTTRSTWKVLEVGTAFPLLKCVRTHGRHCEPFSGQNAVDYRISHVVPTFLWGDTPGIHRSAPDGVKMHGHDTSNVSCGDVTSQVEFGLKKRVELWLFEGISTGSPEVATV